MNYRNKSPCSKNFLKRKKTNFVLIAEGNLLLGQVSLQEFSSASNVLVSTINLGFHRELGVHITKIKSINLDKWPKGVAILFTKISIILLKRQQNCK